MSLVRNNQALLLLKPDSAGVSVKSGVSFNLRWFIKLFAAKVSKLTERNRLRYRVDKIRHLACDKICAHFFPTNQIEWASFNLIAAAQQFVGAEMFLLEVRNKRGGLDCARRLFQRDAAAYG